MSILCGRNITSKYTEAGKPITQAKGISRNTLWSEYRVHRGGLSNMGLQWQRGTRLWKALKWGTNFKDMGSDSKGLTLNQTCAIRS